MKRILIVDDQPNMRQLLQISLKSGDRQILEADSGERAIEMARLERPDLIIMDLVMPGMGGLDAVEILKSDEKTLGCPVLVLTAKDQNQERERAFRMGVSDYVVKPFRIDLLQQQVEKILAA